MKLLIYYNIFISCNLFSSNKFKNRSCTWNSWNNGKKWNPSRNREESEHCQRYRTLKKTNRKGCNNGVSRGSCPSYQNANRDVNCVGSWKAKSKRIGSHWHWWNKWCQDSKWNEYTITVQPCHNGTKCGASAGAKSGEHVNNWKCN